MTATIVNYLLERDSPLSSERMYRIVWKAKNLNETREVVSDQKTVLDIYTGLLATKVMWTVIEEANSHRDVTADFTLMWLHEYWLQN